MRASQLRILTELLSLPTAPFHERHVLDYVRRFCRRQPSLPLAEDRYGNLIAHYRRTRRAASSPIALTAHLDHPGFEALRMIGPKNLRARWRGGVLVDYFVGAGVRFWNDGRWVRGKVRSIRTRRPDRRRPPRAETADIDVTGPVPPGSIGMWDLPEPRVRNGRVYARACDDLSGVAAMLCAMQAVCRRKPPVEFYCLFTRAEEVGFAGALAACKSRSLPRRCAVVNMENSSEIAGVSMGNGPVIRVGDRMTLFSPALTAHLVETAETLARRDKRFRYQRKLMDGGACEATAFTDFGYQTAAMCLALGNYHNMDKGKRRIAPEYIHLDDFANTVKLMTALLLAKPPYTPRPRTVRKALKDLLTEHTSTLLETVAANA